MTANTKIEWADVGPGPDQLLEQARELVVKDRNASTAYVQRKLLISYTRAGRLLEDLEKLGVVGPMNSSGRRKVLKRPSQQPPNTPDDLPAAPVLRESRHELQLQGRHPAPCAASCEANAFRAQARESLLQIDDLIAEVQKQRERIEELEANMRPEWDEAGEPLSLAAAAEDADEWLGLIERLHNGGLGPWKFSHLTSLERLRGCRLALRRFLTPHTAGTSATGQDRTGGTDAEGQRP